MLDTLQMEIRRRYAWCSSVARAGGSRQQHTAVCEQRGPRLCLLFVRCKVFRECFCARTGLSTFSAPRHTTPTRNFPRFCSLETCFTRIFSNSHPPCTVPQSIVGSPPMRGTMAKSASQIWTRAWKHLPRPPLVPPARGAGEVVALFAQREARWLPVIVWRPTPTWCR